MRKPGSILLSAAVSLLLLSGCVAPDRDHVLLVSVPDQQLLLLRKGVPVARYPVSTSKFGLGDRPGSNATPLGKMEIAKKVGDKAVPGTVFKSRKPTGEVIPVNAPGRDPIVTRILWLRGLEPENSRAFDRHIYIHGTPEERNLGKPVSYGCIRMASQDIVELFEIVGRGARVEVIESPLADIRPVPRG